jgi:hypothetical protein
MFGYHLRSRKRTESFKAAVLAAGILRLNSSLHISREVNAYLKESVINNNHLNATCVEY